MVPEKSGETADVPSAALPPLGASLMATGGATGVGTQGQGHFTVLAQIVADALGVAVEDVRVVTGDTREFHWGTGTFASRGAVVAGSACHAAAMSVRGKILDHHGVALADNRPAFNIYATPKLLSSDAKAELERMLGLSDDEIASRLRDYTPPESTVNGVFGKYAKLVSSASEGAVTR